MKRSTPLTRNIGAKVKHYRKLRGLSQKQLAAQLQTNGCDITETMLGHIETGYRSTSIFEIDKLVEVAKTYGAKGLAYTRWTADAKSSSFEKFLTEEEIRALYAAADFAQGDVLLLAADTEFVLGMVKKPPIEQLVREKAAAVLGRAVQVRFVLKTQLGSSGADPLDRLVAFGKEHSDIFTIK